MKTLQRLIPGVLLLAFGQAALAIPKAADVPPLIKKLADKDPKVRAEAAKELGHIARVKTSFVKDAIPALLGAARDTNADVRIAALVALGEANPDPRLAVPVLYDGLKSDSDAVKMAAARGFSHMGRLDPEDAAPSVEELKKIIADVNKLEEAARAEKKQLDGGKRNLREACQTALSEIAGITKKRKKN